MTYREMFIQLAKDEYEREGEIEIDSNAKLSRGDDPGCYVQAWVWVKDPTCATCQGPIASVRRVVRTKAGQFIHGRCQEH